MIKKIYFYIKNISVLFHLLKYGIVTVFGYSIVLGGTYFFVEMLGMGESISYMISVSLSYLMSYFANNYFVFEVQPSKKNLIKFIIFIAVFWALNNISFNIMIKLFGLHYLIAAVLNIATVGVFGFFISRIYVFAAETDKNSDTKENIK